MKNLVKKKHLGHYSKEKENATPKGVNLTPWTTQYIIHMPNRPLPPAKQ